MFVFGYDIIVTMIRDFYKWNEKQFSKGFDASVVLQRGEEDFLGSGKCKKMIIRLGQDIYHIKEPHSRYYKNNKREFGASGTMMDNELATITELMAERRYRSFHLPYAYYELLRGDNGEFKLISKSINNDKVEVKSLSELMHYEDDFISEYALKFSMQNLEEILTKPAICLRVMTRECYDQYVKFLLASVFDFSTDDHFNNIIFIRNQNSMLFESMFLCDKESNVFNPLIAREFSMDEILRKSNSYNHYVGIKVSERGEDFEKRASVLLRLVKKGIMPKKYVKFLSDLAGFDFDAVARDVKGDFGLVADDRQLDIYKRTAEIAGEIAQKG